MYRKWYLHLLSPHGFGLDSWGSQRQFCEDFGYKCFWPLYFMAGWFLLDERCFCLGSIGELSTTSAVQERVNASNSISGALYFGTRGEMAALCEKLRAASPSLPDFSYEIDASVGQAGSPTGSVTVFFPNVCKPPHMDELLKHVSPLNVCQL